MDNQNLIKRRDLLTVGTAAAGGLSAAALVPPANAQSAAVNDELLVVVFLRGGADGLNIMPPLDGPDRARYEVLRPNLKVAASGPDRALPLAEHDGTPFGLNRAAAALKELFDDGHLAVIQAVGMPNSTRSHFDAMAFTELGTPSRISTPDGWLTRHLATADNLPIRIRLPVLSVSSVPQGCLLGSRETVSMHDPQQFGLGYTHWRWSPERDVTPAERPLVDRDETLALLHGGSDPTSRAGNGALDAAAIIAAQDLENYPVNYPDSYLANDLKTVAQILRLDVGLRVAAVELGGWDTHIGQDSGGFFQNELLGPLADGLAAFFNDLEAAGKADKVTVVVQSEFGRRVYENADLGTDHGTGNIMLVLGKNVNGGKIYGSWPGLADGQLFEGEDLAYSTDYRQVLSEVLQQRFFNRRLNEVFPGFAAGPALGFIRGRNDNGNGGGDTLFNSHFG